MRGYDSRTNRATQMTAPSAVTQRLVKVEEVGTKLVHCIDNNGQLYTLRHQISRTRVRPRVGEFWLIDQSYTGAWTFASFVEDTDPVAVTGPVPTGPLVGLVQILSELGLIDDQTTDGGDPPELTGVLKTGSWEAVLSAGLSAMGLADDTAVTYGTAREFPNGSGATTANMRLVPSTHASSERASIEFGPNWTLGMDPQADGTTASKFYLGYSGTVIMTVDGSGKDVVFADGVTGVSSIFDTSSAYLSEAPGGFRTPRIELRNDSVSSDSLKSATLPVSWTQQVGTWVGSTGGSYLSVSGGAANIMTQGFGSSPDIRVTINTNTVTSGKGIVLRYSNTSNYVYITNTPTGWTVVQRVAGVETTLGTIVASSGAGTTIRARVIGTALRVWVNNAFAGDYTIDATLTGNQAGVYATSTNTGVSNAFIEFVGINTSGAGSSNLALQKSGPDILSMVFGENPAINFDPSGITGTAFKWNDWSPLTKQFGTSISRTITFGKYMTLFGKVGVGLLHFSFTAAGPGLGKITVECPTTLGDATHIYGAGYYYDAGTNIYSIAVNSNTTTEMSFIPHGFGSDLGNGFTVANTDGMKFFVVWYIA